MKLEMQDFKGINMSNPQILKRRNLVKTAKTIWNQQNHYLSLSNLYLPIFISNYKKKQCVRRIQVFRTSKQGILAARCKTVSPLLSAMLMRSITWRRLKEAGPGLSTRNSWTARSCPLTTAQWRGDLPSESLRKLRFGSFPRNSFINSTFPFLEAKCNAKHPLSSFLLAKLGFSLSIFRKISASF